MNATATTGEKMMVEANKIDEIIQKVSLGWKLNICFHQNYPLFFNCLSVPFGCYSKFFQIGVLVSSVNGVCVLLRLGQYLHASVLQTLSLNWELAE